MIQILLLAYLINEKSCQDYTDQTSESEDESSSFENNNSG